MKNERNAASGYYSQNPIIYYHSTPGEYTIYSKQEAISSRQEERPAKYEQGSAWNTQGKDAKSIWRVLNKLDSMDLIWIKRELVAP